MRLTTYAHILLPVNERLQQGALVLVEQKQVGGQVEVAAQRLPLARSCTYNPIRLSPGGVLTGGAVEFMLLFLPCRSAGGTVEFR